ncbi:MAG: hypothetical protein ACLQM8_02435 [Limisphaerales bacterium]
MSRVFVAGWGAVSPAGWGVAALGEALNRGQPLPIEPLARPGWEQPLRERPVPPPQRRPQFLAHPRLRRASAITHYALAAALEAAAGLRAGRDGEPPLGLVVCLHSGCVHYSCRFFEETLKDPLTASPLLFPETVFAAPASHAAAVLGNTPLVHTLLGDPATFLQGLALGAAWLEDKRVGACLVIGAEETNWVRADALWHFEHDAIIACGAGALCLSPEPGLSAGVELSAITEAQTYTRGQSRAQAARAMRAQLGGSSAGELLCDGLGDSRRADAAERAAWRDWSGPRLSPKRILGEGHMAAAAWQCVAACDAVAAGRFPAARVSLVGCNQHALGARFVRAESPGRPERGASERRA